MARVDAVAVHTGAVGRSDRSTGRSGVRAVAVAVAAALLWACNVPGPIPAGTPAASTSALAAPTPGAPGSAGVAAPTAATLPGGIPALALPVRSRTPGAVDPTVTQSNIARTICRTGYTTTVRPPASYTGTLKRRQLAAWGYADRDPAHYEEDHLVPLSIGGAPRDERNLWPEPLDAPGADGTNLGAPTKDGFELWLHHRVCDASITLAEAQQMMAVSWVAAWDRAGRP